MASAYHHALSSVKRWGGTVDDFIKYHEWFDASKELMGDFRHRVLRHHTHGIFELERVFGPTITLSNGRIIPTRWVGEQHVTEDLGIIPTLSDWLMWVQPQEWMNKPSKLSQEVEQ
jgi:hypothetical protein